MTRKHARVVEQFWRRCPWRVRATYFYSYSDPAHWRNSELWTRQKPRDECVLQDAKSKQGKQTLINTWFIVKEDVVKMYLITKTHTMYEAVSSNNRNTTKSGPYTIRVSRVSRKKFANPSFQPLLSLLAYDPKFRFLINTIFWAKIRLRIRHGARNHAATDAHVRDSENRSLVLAVLLISDCIDQLPPLHLTKI